MQLTRTILNSLNLASLWTTAYLTSTAYSQITWNGATDTDFATDGNWISGVAPTDNLFSDIATFIAPAPANLPDLSNGDRFVAGLDFQGLGWTLSGISRLSIGINGITNTENTLLTLPLGLPLNTTITATGGFIALQNTDPGGISGSGQLTIAGDNILFIDGANNTYSGGTVIQGSVGVAGGAGSLGTGPILLDGGELFTNGANFFFVAGRTLDLSSNGGMITAADGFFSIQTDITGDGPLTIGGESSTGAPIEDNVFIDVATNFTGAANPADPDVIVQGIVGIRNDDALGQGTNITLDGGTIFVNSGASIPSENIELSNGGADGAGGYILTLTENGGTLAAPGSQRMSIDTPIQGVGALTYGAGGNTLFVDNPNTYSGGSIIQGLVRPNATAGDGAFGAAGTPITFDGGTFQFNVGGGGGTFTFDASRSIILTPAGGTIDTNNGATTTDIPNVISGDGGLTIADVGEGAAGIVVLSGVNTYTGPTTVDEGTLVINGSSIADTNTLNINNIVDDATASGIVEVTGTEIVAELVLNGASQAPGTYGATGSGATNIDDTFFAGTGIIEVIASGVSADFLAWAADFLPEDVSDPAGDNDEDGISNFEEYAFALDPTTGGSVNPFSSILDAPGNDTFTYTRRDTALSSLTYTYNFSNDLVDFTLGDALPAPTETSDGGSPIETVTVTVPAALTSETDLFIQIEAQ